VTTLIKSKVTRVPNPWRGRTLLATRERRKMDRATAARILEISVVRLYLLENGEADMEDPAMWDEVNRQIWEAKVAESEDDA
jgi:hypothetical protein